VQSGIAILGLAINNLAQRGKFPVVGQAAGAGRDGVGLVPRSGRGQPRPRCIKIHASLQGLASNRALTPDPIAQRQPAEFATASKLSVLSVFDPKCPI
jgi:hypothetical protein